MRKAFTLCLFILSSCLHVFPQAETFVIRGKVIDKDRREGIPYCNVYIDGDSTSWTPTDSVGNFRMTKAKPGIHRFFASSIGYKATLTAEYLISATTPFVEIELQEDTRLMGEISVGPQLMRTTGESPVSLYVIGMQDIEKMPGANRDISRIVRSFPGVSFSPIGYRNDLIVRGGGPAENRFFMDGIEIPNINHFATQGASGGPTSIVNADLVREINFYTGAFPANRSGALSSVLDFALVNGNPDRSLAERKRAPQSQDHISVLREAVLSATALQDAGPALSAQLHRRTVQDKVAHHPQGRNHGHGAGRH